jgi:hypothetical protein
MFRQDHQAVCPTADALLPTVPVACWDRADVAQYFAIREEDIARDLLPWRDWILGSGVCARGANGFFGRVVIPHLTKELREGRKMVIARASNFDVRLVDGSIRSDVSHCSVLESCTDDRRWPRPDLVRH